MYCFGILITYTTWIMFLKLLYKYIFLFYDPATIRYTVEQIINKLSQSNQELLFNRRLHFSQKVLSIRIYKEI